ncbi:glycosyl hydrolase catalytic core-domain-containing protein [Usnea florida]
MLFTLQFTSALLLVFCAFVQAKPHARAKPHGHQHSNHQVAARSPSPSSGSTTDSSSSKIGLLYDGTSDLDAFSGKVGFSVDWSPVPLSSSDNLDLGTFIPQLWSYLDSNHLDPWNNAAPSWPDGVSLIGFNEPDMPGQSWMTPSTAISGWDNLAKFQSSKGAKVATPGVSNAVGSQGTINGVANPGGQDWMSQFLSLAASYSPKYTFQAISMHWYGSSSLTVDENGAMLNEQVGAMIQLATAHDIPEVWITEMGSGYNVVTSNGDHDAAAATLECQFIQWLEGTFMTNSSNAMVTHYAYNEHLQSLLNGASITPSGSALLGGTGSCS